MHQPNVIGDWREYEDDFKGLRVRVHSFKKDDLPRDGRDKEAKGLTYFSFRVTVENRAEEWFLIELERRHLDVRTGKDGEAAFVDYNSKEIEGFKLYPLRRATATFYAAAPARQLSVVDIQIDMRVDDEQPGPQVWVGGADVPDSTTRTGRASRSKNSIATEVSKFLEEHGTNEQGATDA